MVVLEKIGKQFPCQNVLCKVGQKGSEQAK